MDGLRQDLRFAVRTLGRAPAFALLSALTLAIGIGASATLFTWLNAVLLQPLPGTHEPQRLLEIHGTSRTEPIISISYPDYLDLRGLPSLAAVVATNEQPATLSVGRDSERIWTQLVSANFFQALGVVPALGRAFRPEDDAAPMRDAVVVLGHGLWQRRFGADPAIVGREVGINGRPFTVIGVAPPAFRGSIVALSFDAWVPMAMQQPLGLALGLAGAVGIGRLLAKLLLGVSPTDLPTFAAVLALMLGVALAATLVPAWGATRLDPSVALRKE